eukprot:TRINITY_DN5804_c0_g1_i2.p1 TRINITY_DN5804_c0_g1~~TRINITY_DN5804_c0_g1_i2.p1  ORF type:complete len:357 (-),score=88.86 TRINITY_DN5804_c0_g1_i2:183-1253(-)
MKQLLINQYLQKLVPVRSTSSIAYQTESGSQKPRKTEVQNIISITSAPMISNEQLPSLISRNLINKYIKERLPEELPLLEPKSHTQYFIEQKTSKNEFIERYVIKGHSINLKAKRAFFKEQLKTNLENSKKIPHILRESQANKETSLNKSWTNKKQNAMGLHAPSIAQTGKTEGKQHAETRRASKSPQKDSSKKKSEDGAKPKLNSTMAPKHYALSKVKSDRKSVQSSAKPKKKNSSMLHRIIENDKQGIKPNSKYIKSCFRQAVTSAPKSDNQINLKKLNTVPVNEAMGGNRNAEKTVKNEKEMKANVVIRPKINLMHNIAPKKQEELPAIPMERLKQKSKPSFLPHDHDYTVRA